MELSKTNLRNTENQIFKKFWEIYEYSFPLCERNSLENQMRIFQLKEYSLEIYINNQEIIGFIGWWSYPDFRYVEHFAINPLYRSKGYGKKILQEWIDQSTTVVILEIEPVTDSITSRRLHFYQSLFFIENNIDHAHPPYHKGMEYVKLEILSYPNLITEELYEKFFNIQKNEIIKP